MIIANLKKLFFFQNNYKNSKKNFKNFDLVKI